MECNFYFKWNIVNKYKHYKSYTVGRSKVESEINFQIEAIEAKISGKQSVAANAKLIKSVISLKKIY